MGAKVTLATLHEYEVREGKVWKAAGWIVQGTWKQAIFIGPGRLITKPKDFFGTKEQAGFDTIAVHPAGRVAFIQTTASPFVKERDGKQDRNAAHGEPPFSFDMFGGPDAWMRNADARQPSIGTVIVSYADSRNPERRWWTRAPSVESKGERDSG